MSRLPMHLMAGSTILAGLLALAPASAPPAAGGGVGLVVAGAEVLRTRGQGAELWEAGVWTTLGSGGGLGGRTCATLGPGSIRAGAEVGMVIGGGLLVGGLGGGPRWRPPTRRDPRPRRWQRPVGLGLFGAGIALWLADGALRLWASRRPACGAGAGACGLSAATGVGLASLGLAGVGLASAALASPRLGEGPRLRSLRLGPMGLAGGAGLSISGTF